MTKIMPLRRGPGEVGQIDLRPVLWFAPLAALTLMMLSVVARADQVRTHQAHFGSSSNTRDLGPPIDPTKPRRTITIFEPDGAMVKQTDLPYWEVGVIDKKLSALCSTGRFNQAETNRLTVGFNGEVGAAVLGVARGDGWNLYDPTRAGRKDDTYFFHRDRTGQCTVFFWNAQERKRRIGAVMYPPGYQRELVDASYKRPDQRTR